MADVTRYMFTPYGMVADPQGLYILHADHADHAALLAERDARIAGLEAALARVRACPRLGMEGVDSKDGFATTFRFVIHDDGRYMLAADVLAALRAGQTGGET